MFELLPMRIFTLKRGTLQSQFDKGSFANATAEPRLLEKLQLNWIH